MMRLFVFLSLICFSQAALAANIVTTIKPLHSLTSLIMEGSGSTPTLLISGSQSLHSFSLKPSQIAQVNKADIVFYIHPDFEMFMPKVLKAAPQNVRALALAEQKNIRLLPVRQGGGFEAHHHEDKHEHEHEEENIDLHIWSAPENAKVMLAAIAAELIHIDPAQKTLYEKNLMNAIARVEALDKELKTRMAKLSGKRFVTFHDATQYFETAYGLQAVGSLTLHPERGTSAKHIRNIQQKIRDTKATCVFREPQFEGKVISQLLQGTAVKSQAMDPEASALTPSPALYFELMNGLAASFEACLG